jgi:hypothetical protein
MPERSVRLGEIPGPGARPADGGLDVALRLTELLGHRRFERVDPGMGDGHIGRDLH